MSFFAEKIRFDIVQTENVRFDIVETERCDEKTVSPKNQIFLPKPFLFSITF